MSETSELPPPLRVLFLCTHNSARSQIAEALLERKGRGRFEVASAGTEPAPRIYPAVIEVLREQGIDWSGKQPKPVSSVSGETWDFIITVCDRARESCPAFPGQPSFAHWGIKDPAEGLGDKRQRGRAFREALTYLSRRIDLMLALPFESLTARAAEGRLNAIGNHTEEKQGPRLV